MNSLVDKIRPLQIKKNIEMSLVGRKMSEAKLILEELKVDYRYVSINDKEVMITDDLNPDRLNITLVNNVITSINYG